MKRLNYYLAFSVLFISCADDEVQQEIDATAAGNVEIIDNKITSRDDVNEKIKNALSEGRNFKWSELDAEDLWTAIELSDYQVNVFWGMDDSSAKTENDIERIILDNEDTTVADGERSPITYVNKNLHFLSAVIQNKETFKLLLDSDRVEMIEPLYDMVIAAEENVQPSNEPSSESQSSKSGGKQWMWKGDSFNIPYSFSAYLSNAEVAWERGFDGRGIGIGVIDCGILRGHPLHDTKKSSTYQKIKNPKKNTTYNRFFRRRSTFPDRWNGCPFEKWKCQDDGYARPGRWPFPDNTHHAARMLTIAGGVSTNDFYKPNSKEKYWGTGLAYGANLYNVKGSDVVALIGSRSRAGVIRAFEFLADQKSIHIISMSMGTPFHDEGIARAIKHAHRKGKMIFVAGGTVIKGLTDYMNDIDPEVGSVIGLGKTQTLFPANLKEAYSVTGVNEKGNWCYRCHGIADFTVQFDESRITDHFIDGRAGTSSQSTATMAGIAAAIWGTNRHMSREQVYNIMRSLSQYPKKHRFFGHGTIDLTNFNGATKPMKKAKNMRFRGSENTFLTSNNTNIVFAKSGKGTKQRFKIIDLGNNTIALRADNGRYISLHANGTLRPTALGLGKDQRFKVYTNNDGKVALRGSNNKFISFGGGSIFSESTGSVTRSVALTGSAVSCTSERADEFAWFEMN